MFAPLGPGLEDNEEAASGLSERRRDAVAEAILEVDHELAAQAAERATPQLRNRPVGPLHWDVKNIAEHTSRIELGVMLASLAEVAQTHVR